MSVKIFSEPSYQSFLCSYMSVESCNSSSFHFNGNMFHRIIELEDIIEIIQYNILLHAESTLEQHFPSWVTLWYVDQLPEFISQYDFCLGFWELYLNAAQVGKCYFRISLTGDLTTCLKTSCKGEFSISWGKLFHWLTPCHFSSLRFQVPVSDLSSSAVCQNPRFWSPA